MFSKYKDWDIISSRDTLACGELDGKGQEGGNVNILVMEPGLQHITNISLSSLIHFVRKSF